VDLSHLDSGALQIVLDLTFTAMGACGSGVWTWGSCACRPCVVHGVTHMSALDIRSRVLRGNVPGHRLPGCEYVGPTRTSGPLRGCMSHLAQFRIWSVVAHVYIMT